jgi:threonine dehydrogenase-like Zn-dependent dehydrogenase
MSAIPKTQHAVQLTGPSELTFTDTKEVFQPGPGQILGKTEAIGLCFSDIKLFKQFDKHVRKNEVQTMLTSAELDTMPNYAPNEKPTVPGHEVCLRVVAVGEGVTSVTVGHRYLVQTDYRWLLTPESNSAFGYNFEGGLQEYVLLDERVITSPDGESLLIPASDDLAASAVALAEPWACVESSYSNPERQQLCKDGRMLLVVQSDIDLDALNAFLQKYGNPASITLIGENKIEIPGVEVIVANNIADLPPKGFDDIVYFGCDVETLESLFDKLDKDAFINIVQCGEQFSRPVEALVGRVHYGNVRIIGTPGLDPADAMTIIPENCEIRENDKISVIGAAGPMGTMHVIRNICQGVKGISLFPSSRSDDRVTYIDKTCAPFAKKHNILFEAYNSKTTKPDTLMDYIVIMAPVPQLVTQAVQDCAQNGAINIFAGIPAEVSATVDMNKYIAMRQYFIGTSGSTMDDMKCVLKKVESGQLDTNISVMAVTGLKEVYKGIQAVEDNVYCGKIVVYPTCKDLPLTTLEDLEPIKPGVIDKLDNGVWNKEAELKLIS